MDKKAEATLQPYMRITWKIAKLYNSCFFESQKKHGITANERDVLLFLHNNKGYDTAADIVAYRSISKSLVSKSVESLIRRGFLVALQMADDRRQLHLRITHEADSTVQELVKAQQHFFEMLDEGIPKAERNIFHQVLIKLEDNAERYGNKE